LRNEIKIGCFSCWHTEEHLNMKSSASARHFYWPQEGFGRETGRSFSRAMSRLLLSLLCYPQCLLKKFLRQIAMSRILLSLLCYPQGQDSWIHCTQMKGRQSRMERDTRDGSKLGSKGLILEWRWTAQTLSDS
jgi:hypothetical protein